MSINSLRLHGGKTGGCATRLVSLVKVQRAIPSIAGCVSLRTRLSNEVTAPPCRKCSAALFSSTAVWISLKASKHSCWNCCSRRKRMSLGRRPRVISVGRSVRWTKLSRCNPTRASCLLTELTSIIPRTNVPASSS
jgi:hypothetical protein